MQTDAILLEHEGQTCEVYFFRGWSGYSHPVKPQDPIYLEDAIAGPSYYRVWMCGQGDEKLFVKFQGISNHRQAVATIKSEDKPNAPGVFELLEDRGGIRVGPQFDIQQIDDHEVFLYHSGNPEASFEKISPASTISYTYKYDDFGVLQTVTIVNFDGEISTLNMS